MWLQQNGHRLADDTFKSIYLIKMCIFIQISLKFISRNLINDRLALVQLMAGHQTGQAIIWINDGLINSCIYAWFALGELTL